VAPIVPWLPVLLLVAVSEDAVHVCDWDDAHGTERELARFGRSTTAVSIDSYRRSRRLTLTDDATGYRLPLTATVSRLNLYGSGARQVLAALQPGALVPRSYPGLARSE
jgi:hypothetical protein